MTTGLKVLKYILAILASILVAYIFVKDNASHPRIKNGFYTCLVGLSVGSFILSMIFGILIFFVITKVFFPANYVCSKGNKTPSTCKKKKKKK